MINTPPPPPPPTHDPRPTLKRSWQNVVRVALSVHLFSGEWTLRQILLTDSWARSKGDAMAVPILSFLIIPLSMTYPIYVS